MDFITVTDIYGAVHQVDPQQIVHVSPINVVATSTSQVVLSNGFVIHIAGDATAFATHIVVAIPTITIGALPI